MRTPQVTPAELAQLAVSLARNDKPNWTAAVDLLARAVALVPEVHKKAAQIAKQRPADRVSMSDACKILRRNRVTVLKHLHEMDYDEGDLSTRLLAVLKEKIANVRSDDALVRRPGPKPPGKKV